MKNNKLNIVVMVVLAVAVVGLGVALVMIYNSRYDEGVKVGETKQIESIKTDKNKAVVPDFIGQNAKQAVRWDWTNPSVYVKSSITIPVRFKSPNGEEITEDSASEYKITAQEPKAGTVFDLVYKKGDDGYVYDHILESSGVQEFVVTVEKIK